MNLYNFHVTRPAVGDVIVVRAGNEHDALDDPKVRYSRGATAEIELAYISFDNGVCRRLRTRTPGEQQAEALQACEAVQLGATVLDEAYGVRFYVRRTASARGFLVYAA